MCVPNGARVPRLDAGPPRPPCPTTTRIGQSTAMGDLLVDTSARLQRANICNLQHAAVCCIHIVNESRHNAALLVARDLLPALSLPSSSAGKLQPERTCISNRSFRACPSSVRMRQTASGTTTIPAAIAGYHDATNVQSTLLQFHGQGRRSTTHDTCTSPSLALD